MHGIVITVDIDAGRAEEAQQLLQELVIPTTKSQAGFVRGVWLRSKDGSDGRAFMLFDTEQHANAAAELAKQGPPEGSPTTLRAIDVFEGVACRRSRRRS